MQINVEADVYDGFRKLKEFCNKSLLSDSEFLSHIVNHVKKCNLENNGSRLEKTSCNGSDVIAKRPCTRTCPECKFSAPSEILYEHFEKIHAADGSFSCTCGDSYSRLPLFLRHYIDCPIAATDLQDPCRDVLTPKKIKVEPVSSEDSTKPTNSINQITQSNPARLYHSYRHPSVSPIAGPSGDKPYGCPKCWKGFKSKSLLDQHMHLHYPPRYKCRWCGNVYRWPPVYYHHKQKCKKRPMFTSSGMEYLNDFHTSLEDSSSKSDDHPFSNDRSALAQHTFAQFINMPSLSFPSHDFLSESTLPVVSSDDISGFPLVCVCNESFMNFSSYLEHVGSCPKLITASSALKSFTNQALTTASGRVLDVSHNSVSIIDESELSSFKNCPAVQVPITNGIFSCPICGKDFNSKLSLKQHVDGKHRAEGKYLCPTCGKRYRWGASFYYHKKTCMSSDQSDGLDSRAPELLTTRT